jgi:hypothetical protein
MLSKLNERLQKWGFSWEGLRDNRHGEWWLLAQMILIAAHWLPPTPPPSALGIHWPLALRLIGGLTVLIGLVLGAQGALNLGDSLSPLPEPMPGAPLITKGGHPWSHQSLHAPLPSGAIWIDQLEAPEQEQLREGAGVEALLDRLPAGQAAIIRLSVLEGQSLRQIGHQLGMSAMSVQRHRQRGLAALKAELA